MHMCIFNNFRKRFGPYNPSLTRTNKFPQQHLDVNQSFSSVDNFKPLYQALLNLLVVSRKLNETAQSGLGAEVLRSLLGKLEADVCSWVSG